LYVSFAEYCLLNRALLQKRPIILSILLTKATPYISNHYRTDFLAILLDGDTIQILSGIYEENVVLETR